MSQLSLAQRAKRDPCLDANPSHLCSLSVCLSLSLSHTHTHTHTHISQVAQAGLAWKSWSQVFSFASPLSAGSAGRSHSWPGAFILVHLGLTAISLLPALSCLPEEAVALCALQPSTGSSPAQSPGSEPLGRAGSPLDLAARTNTGCIGRR
jgi:hypothetical protein